ncbi:aspartate/glutamate racemase family protein [Paraburkholderia susongensis]|uniref:Asp/Glu/hydantoin racemase n=1 Tax=Paraburkholderia susongensis TaxID=1515439 RepID=A0A1X7M4P9_9BURK|nr:aspartate/glutamate racemase family protein [Paraburkholderia susongensis]SMG60359.1 Asp/Glu/hydantoin racemase [Paraburkholderia susongensis]
MSETIAFLNPNGLAEVTAQIERSVRALRRAADPEVTFATLAAVEGGIVTQRDADRAAVAVAEHAVRHERNVSAFVICCYSDPGLHAAREAVSRPVIGIGSTGLATALAIGERPGVIAVSSKGMPRHWRAYHAARLGGAVVGERAADLPVDESGGTRALERLVSTGKALRDDDGADVIVLGCAGMTPLRDELEHRLGIAVVDPCSAAAALAFSLCRGRGAQGGPA